MVYGFKDLEVAHYLIYRKEDLLLYSFRSCRFVDIPLTEEGSGLNYLLIPGK